MIGAVLKGIAALPELLDRLDRIVEFFDKMEKARWLERAVDIENRLYEAEKRQEKLEIAKEIQDLGHNT